MLPSSMAKNPMAYTTVAAVGDDERAALEQGGVDDGVIVVQGAMSEHGAGHERHGEGGEDAPIGPAPRRPFGDGEHE